MTCYTARERQLSTRSPDLALPDELIRQLKTRMLYTISAMSSTKDLCEKARCGMSGMSSWGRSSGRPFLLDVGIEHVGVLPRPREAVRRNKLIYLFDTES
jgi:hypothetical protein